MSYNCTWSASRSNRSSLHYHAQLEVHPKQGSNFFTQLNSGGTGQCGPQHNATSLSISTGLCVSEPTTHYPLPMLVKPLPTIHVSEPMSLDVIVQLFFISQPNASLNRVLRFHLLVKEGAEERSMFIQDPSSQNHATYLDLAILIGDDGYNPLTAKKYLLNQQGQHLIEILCTSRFH